MRGPLPSSSASAEFQYDDAGGHGEEHQRTAADEDGGGAAPVEEEASGRGPEGGGRQEYGAARGQNRGERVGGGAVLDQGEGERGVGAVDESGEGEADQGGDGGVRESEGEHADAVARDDAEHGRPQGKPFGRTQGESADESSDAESGPVGAEQPRARIEVAGDEQGKRDLDGAEGEVEHPGHEEQPEQFRLMAQNAQPALGPAGRRGNRRPGQGGAAGLEGEHGERGSVQTDDPCRGHRSCENTRQSGARDGRAPQAGAEHAVGRQALVVGEQGSEERVLPGLAPGVEQRGGGQEPDVHGRRQQPRQMCERDRPQQYGP